jgi:hypothetical protein
VNKTEGNVGVARLVLVDDFASSLHAMGIITSVLDHNVADEHDLNVSKSVRKKIANGSSNYERWCENGKVL